MAAPEDFEDDVVQNPKPACDVLRERNVNAREEAEDERYTLATERPSESTEQKWRRELDERDLSIIPVSGDGNCLFRSIAHQVYGDEQTWDIVRKKTVEYMIVEKSYFSQYIGGDFDGYVNKMKRSGVWGGNIEIQAMSEMYQRPIEIYAYSPTPMKTYSNENSNLTDFPPLRLSYHMRSHYNSIVNPNIHCDNILRVDPGAWEDEKIAEAKNTLHLRIDLNITTTQPSDLAAEMYQFQQALRESRSLFSPQSANDLDTAVALSLQTMFNAEKKDKDLIERKKNETLTSITNNTVVDDPELQMALQQSLAQPNIGMEDPELQMALQQSLNPSHNEQDEALQHALAASLTEDSLKYPPVVQQLVNMGFDEEQCILVYTEFEQYNYEYPILFEKMEWALISKLK